MNVYVNYPNDDNGKKELAHAKAKFHAFLVMKAVDNLNLDELSKRKVIKSLLEKVKLETSKEE